MQRTHVLSKTSSRASLLRDHTQEHGPVCSIPARCPKYRYVFYSLCLSVSRGSCIAFEAKISHSNSGFGSRFRVGRRAAICGKFLVVTSLGLRSLLSSVHLPVSQSMFGLAILEGNSGKAGLA
jgi:hypothetical protein